MAMQRLAVNLFSDLVIKNLVQQGKYSAISHIMTELRTYIDINPEHIVKPLFLRRD
jgi:hypothetical protein